MALNIKRAAVLGSGTMGSGIAAHLANCGIETLVYDIVPKALTDPQQAQGLTTESPEFRNSIAANAINAMKKSRLAPLYDIDNIELLSPANLEDDFDELSEVDWIVEVVPESLKIKQPLFEKLEGIHRKGQIVSSNTSGIALDEITKGRCPEFCQHVMITHFFNPPRYMHLLELVPGEHTDRKIFSQMSEFARLTLGKGVAVAKDTPNFIANRVGVFDMCIAVQAAVKLGLKVEDVDAIMGKLVGRPKSAVFRLMDLVGLDIAVHVNSNLYEAIPEDPDRETFSDNSLLEKMVNKGILGEKSGNGFYQKDKDEKGNRIFKAIDFESLDYYETQKCELKILKEAKAQDDLGARIRVFMESEDKVGEYVWTVISSTLCYAANRVPEISESIEDVDNAIRWGFNWEKGPFELWDAIGVPYIVKRLKKENRSVPPLVQHLLDQGKESFYCFETHHPYVFNPREMTHNLIERPFAELYLRDCHQNKQVVKAGKMASLVDLEDGVLCVEFHSRANSISSEVISLIHEAIDLAESGQFRGVVIGNQSANFSFGADLKEMAGAVMTGNYQAIDEIVNQFQQTMLRLKYSRVPTVAAIHGMVLGGACEVSMQCDKIHAAAETYMGLVEIGVGLVPAGGGCKEWAIRCNQWAKNAGDASSFAMVNKALEQVGMAKTSTSAFDARKIGYLRPSDAVTMNKNVLLYTAKHSVIQMANQGYVPPLKANDILVLGRGGLAEFKVRLNIWRQGQFISEYDEFLANKVAYILCGGDVMDNSVVTEQYFLDLEREAFVALLKEPKTLARIQHTLKTGKPLRN